jgi:probable rRNA maturation factor
VAKPSISLLWRKTEPSPKATDRLTHVAEAVCARLDRAGEALEIAIVDDDESRRLNRDFLGRDRPTNVVSFGSAEEGELGQLAVNIDFAKREASETGYGHLYLVGYYMIHGLLHLAGYDHERVTPAEAESMADAEKAMTDLLTPLTRKKEGK